MSHIHEDYVRHCVQGTVYDYHATIREGGGVLELTFQSSLGVVPDDSIRTYSKIVERLQHVWYYTIYNKNGGRGKI